MVVGRHRHVRSQRLCLPLVDGCASLGVGQRERGMQVLQDNVHGRLSILNLTQRSARIDTTRSAMLRASTSRSQARESAC
jgi:hypothetical protein